MNKHPQGTVEYYRSIFMTDGLHEMITEITNIMKEAGKPITPLRLDNFIKAVLYGCDNDGTVRVRPPQPDFNDIKSDYGKFKFEKRVHELWIKQRNRGV